MSSGLIEGKGLNKDDVNYRHMEQCKTCMHFYPANSCDIVDGNISSDAICSKWDMKPRDEGKDGEFYREEYTKVNDAS